MPSPEIVREAIHLIEVIAAPLTLLALFFAWRQFIDARHHTKELGKIENALSTRFMGTFPEYLKDITDLIERATKSICILCDYPAYCSFTDHRQYERYRNALRDQLIADPSLTICLTCLDRSRRDKADREQFATAIADWENWKRENRETLEKLRKDHKMSVTLDALTIEQFFEMGESDNQRIIDDFGGVGVREVSVDISIHFWIIDGREAIFTIPLRDTLEYGFFTSDNKLITAFSQLADRFSGTIAPTSST